ncbi:HAD family hydrolase [Nostoc linckia z18]|uniref:HAD family hydrolase n=2 Tax=Nostoc linckia TaxID=92942 RepID=A0A9Q6ELW6_NOSLI|nr:HAD family phosphatase [Nostoc linckia]PHK38879.1 HAD family hydrolase [Nostoc linckia z15]PHK44675.1 HAD family hydrolase [Nostoc linckia z16]PHJ63516.1 HAD family hydrolase [Nostoc linckia z1]PHJ68492.1 HAD family hydrolase [Nostoc linckia z3]PHJ74262.1 HAD family hydrolase [Nostoc linckia z2]
MCKIKAVIFDMDGVLIDAKDWHYEALNRALKLFAYEINRYDHLVTFDGLPTRKKLEILTKEHGLPIALHSFLNELKQLYTLELVHARCKPIFQHEYALSNLKALSYKLAVASNSIRHTIEVMMQKSNLIDYLDVILSNQDVKFGKPDPEIYLKAISQLELKPQECLVVEDNENGIRAAQEAGANLMVVESVYDVTLDNILNRIQHIEAYLK